MWLFLGFHSIKTTTTIAYPLWDATPEKVASLYFVNFPLWFKFRLSLFWGEYIALGYVEIFKVCKLADLLSSHKFLGPIPKDPRAWSDWSSTRWHYTAVKYCCCHVWRCDSHVLRCNSSIKWSCDSQVTRFASLAGRRYKRGRQWCNGHLGRSHSHAWSGNGGLSFKWVCDNWALNKIGCWG